MLTPENMTELEGKVQEFGDNLKGVYTREFFKMVRDVFEIRVPAFRPVVSDLPGYNLAIQEFHHQLRVKVCESPMYFPAGVVDNIYRDFCRRITDEEFGPAVIPLFDGWNLDEALISGVSRQLVWIGKVDEWKRDLLLEQLLEETAADLKEALESEYPSDSEWIADIAQVQAEVVEMWSFNLRWLLRLIPELDESHKSKFVSDYNRKLAQVTEDYLVEYERRDEEGSRTDTMGIRGAAPKSAYQSLMEENQRIMSATAGMVWTAMSNTFGSFVRYFRDKVMRRLDFGKMAETLMALAMKKEEQPEANVNVEEGEQAITNGEQAEPEPAPSTSRAALSGVVVPIMKKGKSGAASGEGGRGRKRKVASFAAGAKKAKY